MPPEEMPSTMILIRMQSRWCRRDHLDVGAAGAEQKAAGGTNGFLCMRTDLMVLDISSTGAEGTCQTGFRDMEGLHHLEGAGPQDRGSAEVAGSAAFCGGTSQRNLVLFGG